MGNKHAALVIMAGLTLAAGAHAKTPPRPDPIKAAFVVLGEDGEPQARVITALVAWYTSAAGVINGMLGRTALFVGKPMFNLTPTRP